MVGHDGELSVGQVDVLRAVVDDVASRREHAAAAARPVAVEHVRRPVDLEEHLAPQVVEADDAAERHLDDSEGTAVATPVLARPPQLQLVDHFAAERGGWGGRSRSAAYAGLSQHYLGA